jgi:hypothetical protein
MPSSDVGFKEYLCDALIFFPEPFREKLQVLLNLRLSGMFKQAEKSLNRII